MRCCCACAGGGVVGDGRGAARGAGVGGGGHGSGGAMRYGVGNERAGGPSVVELVRCCCACAGGGVVGDGAWCGVKPQAGAPSEACRGAARGAGVGGGGHGAGGAMRYGVGTERAGSQRPGGDVASV